MKLFTEIYVYITFIVYVLCSTVIVHYSTGFNWRNWRNWQSYDWLIAGILISFLGKIADACYWQITWTSYIRGYQSSEFLITHGPSANIPLRQLPILIAALCHIKAATLTLKEECDRCKVMVYSVLVAVGLYLACNIIASILSDLHF